MTTTGGRLAAAELALRSGDAVITRRRRGLVGTQKRRQAVIGGSSINARTNIRLPTVPKHTDRPLDQQAFEKEGRSTGNLVIIACDDVKASGTNCWSLLRSRAHKKRGAVGCRDEFLDHVDDGKEQ